MTVQDSLVQAATNQWIRWGGPSEDAASEYHGFTDPHMERQAPYFGYVHEYWQSIGVELSGKNATAWSGAFICYCFKKADVGKKFPFRDNHSVYCAQIEAGKFAGLSIEDPASTRLARGDLLWASRTGDSCRKPPVTFAAAKQELAQIAAGGDGFCSHSDIVVAVRPGEVDVIGGNVHDAVTKTTYRLDRSGFIADGRRTFVGVIKNAL